MFEQATKQKLRFDSSKGSLTVEDLWDLNLSAGSCSLDTLAKSINREIKQAEEESFVVKRSRASETLNLKFEIVKHIIDVRVAEAEAKVEATERKKQRIKIMELIAKKEDQSLENKSLDELKALLGS